MIHVGITGTREGCHNGQLKVLKGVLSTLALLEDDVVVHHGCCVGVDEEAHDIARKLGLSLHLHPPVKTSLMMDIGKSVDDTMDYVINEPKEYLERNKDIVLSSDILIGVPHSTVEKGGTWFTINYAKNLKGWNKKVMVILQEGLVRVLFNSN